MKIGAFRVMSITTSGVLLAAVGFALLVSPYIGSAYLRIINRLGTELPLLTKDFSLPLLGNANNLFSTFPERPVWSWCLWLVLFCWPIALLVWSIRTADFEKTAVRWCICVIAYMSLTGTMALIGIIGLLLPFTEM
ncbi:MAG: hypothetical protein AB1659_09245 [Thermodesulfobacteriota bacterium]